MARGMSRVDTQDNDMQFHGPYQQQWVWELAVSTGF